MNALQILVHTKKIAERLLAARISGYPSTIIQIIPDKRRREAWFFYPSILRSIIEEHQVDLILDVGANVGQFALGVRRFYKGPIISFEPVARTFTILRNTAPQDTNWFKFNYALGNKSGEQYMNVSEMDQLSSLLEANEDSIKRFGDSAARSTKELVQIRRFDDIVNEMPFAVHSRKILLKTDTQGYDLEVFRGARSIRESIVAIQAEVYHESVYHGTPYWTESINEYAAAGFRLAGLYPVTRDGLYYLSSDCLMVR
jgi:FkbM family methyltransferase